jgi:hypothetical protein
MNQGVMNLVIKAIDSATPTLRKIGKGFGNLKNVSITAFKGIAAASAIVGAALIGFGVSAVKAALDDERATLKLNAALKARGILTDGLKAAIDEQIVSMAALGIEDDEVRAGIEMSSRFFSKQADILAVNAAAADIAAVTGGDLAEIITTIGKGARGSTRGLEALGITVKKGANLQQILTATTEKYGGIAAEIANSTSGRLASAQIRFNEAIEEFGYRLMPVFEEALKWATEEGLPAFEAALGVVGDAYFSLYNENIKPLIEALDELAMSFGAAGGAIEIFATTTSIALTPLKILLEAMRITVEAIAGALRFIRGAPDPATVAASAGLPSAQYYPSYPGAPTPGGAATTPPLTVVIGTKPVDGVVRDSMGRILGTTPGPR